jgi:hypothetical protein
MFHGYYSSTCSYQAERCTAVHSLAYKSQRKTMKERRQKHRKKKNETVRRTREQKEEE